ncbi:DUF418 domain-containing protein [Salinicoccus siamensis]|uniref:DUF418 domain-containing protein n=1 Tax=Salinicoccus siamensis TaxID=381830 RepID=A0ABV5Z0T4_9STAP
MKREYLPVGSADRVHEIDAVRGFALFGILMMNIMSFAGPQMENQLTFDASDIYTGSNSVIILLINIFVTANFYTMFSFLFGLGFYIFLSRAKNRTQQVNRLFIRRMSILLIIGLLHAIFVWYGDILTVYAVTGIILLLFYRLNPRLNLFISTMILLLGSVFVILMTMLALSLPDINAETASSPVYGINMIEASNGSYWDIVSLNLSILGLMSVNNIAMVPLVLAVFLIGLFVGQKGYHTRLWSLKKMLWKIVIIGIGVGLPVKVITGYAMTYGMESPALSVLSMLAYTLGGPLMSLGYTALLALIFLRFQSFTKMLQPVGQLALTNYIMQSVLMIVLFFGFNLFNQIGALWFPLIVAATFGFQIVVSHLWMRYFKYGPLEWIWRISTYGKILSIKK